MDAFKSQVLSKEPWLRSCLLSTSVGIAKTSPVFCVSHRDFPGFFLSTNTCDVSDEFFVQFNLSILFKKCIDISYKV